MYYLEKLSALISKYMAVLVIAIAAIALIEPMSFKWAAPNITMLLGIVMFGMGMTLKLADFKEPDGQRFGILEKVKRTLFFRT